MQDSRCLRPLASLACLILMAAHVAAQDSRLQAQLESLYSIAELNNSSVKSFQSAIDAARAAYEAAQTDVLPDIETQVSASYNGNGRVWDRDFTDTHVAKIPHFGNMAQVRASMPLYTGGAITSGINLSKQGLLMAQLDADENRSDVRMLITRLYLSMHSLLNQERVFDDNIALADQMVQLMSKRCDQGVVLPNDVTRYELMREKLALARIQVQNQFRIIRHQLSVALGIDTLVTVLPDSSFVLQGLSLYTEPELQRLAGDNAHGLKKAALAVEINKQKERLERAALKPTVGVEFVDNLNGPITIDIPALDNNFNYWYVGVGLKYNVSSLFKNNKKVRQARAQTIHALDARDALGQQVSVAVQAAYTDYQTALAALDSNVKNVQLSGQNYQVVANRYDNGLALITDLLDAANEKLDAELKLVDARINVILNHYNIKYVCGTL